MVASPQAQDLPSRVARLEALLDAESRKTLYSAVISSGGLTINDGGITIGPGGSIQLPAGGTVRDAAGNIIFSADSLTGQRLSTPFLPVPMTPMWDGNDGATFRSGGSTGGYAFQAQHCTTETTLWRGFIPQVVHPGVFYNIDVGRLTGATSTPTYRLYINGHLVDTFSTTSNTFYSSPFRDITSITSFGLTNVSASVTMQANVTSADYFNCTVWGLVMCGN
jgi:hypothetical protein